ncbi:sugar ABC transporter substrate-binding protein [Neobacillus notoginsengisoli]|uniref:Sugar ABC transporter substrate-binding protein n=1 Tax=Neobacillus notoginsengisoli TaxID=1578198 RepID=A0A417YIP2_9BACI|nr:substrate-binding domain-containing protein [Neobacillus notoginsengisoli]RHW32804.1 sugar ABC transporter substrate-binding protein [Neobacillus notoginsengisoli]
MMKKRIVLTCLLLATLLVSSACSNSTAGKKKDDGKITFGVTFQTLQHEFFVSMKKGLEETAKEHNVEILFSDANFQFDKQQSAMEDFSSQKVDAILTVPVNSEGIASSIKSAKSKGIPVVTLDIGSNEEVEDLYIASDNYLGGKLAAEYLTKTLGITSGNIFIMTAPEDLSIRERVDGFKEVLKDFPNIKIATDQHGGVSRDKALQITENVLQSNPKLDIIFSSNDEMTMGALKAVQAAKKEKDITIIGYDLSQDIAEEIKKGSAIKAVTAQDPYAIGKAAIEDALKLINKEKLPKKIGIDVKVVDAKNIDEVTN